MLKLLLSVCAICVQTFVLSQHTKFPSFPGGENFIIKANTSTDFQLWVLHTSGKHFSMKLLITLCRMDRSHSCLQITKTNTERTPLLSCWRQVKSFMQAIKTVINELLSLLALGILCRRNSLPLQALPMQI